MSAFGHRIWLLAVVLTPWAMSDSEAASDGLASHRAIYGMSLKSADQSSDIAELTGQMLIETIDACDGWVLKQRIALVITNYQGDEVNSYTSFTSWESKDGRRFRFEQETKHNDVVVEELGGVASMIPDGGGMVVFNQPGASNMELAPGTLFPTQHAALLIASAEAGEVFVNRVVFDGTTAEGPSQVSAFISAPRDGPRLPGEVSAPRVWPVRLAFYDVASSASAPDVEIGLLLQSDGVMRHMVLDYGTFSIEGRLEKLELLPPIEC